MRCFHENIFILECKQISAILVQIFLELNNCVLFCFFLCVCFFLSSTKWTKLYICKRLKNIEIKIDGYSLLSR